MAASPFITISPVAKKIDVELGGTFTIICEAVGTPTPLIVWRLNWGNIPVSDRVFTSSIGGRGNLTITRARIEDSGAYTCEAINTRGSIFATPDVIITVRIGGLAFSHNRNRLKKLQIRIYDKRDEFNFPIVNFQFIDSNIPAGPAYGPACREEMFKCANGQCVPQSQMCDNRPECEDGSDEENCPLVIRNLTIINNDLVVKEGETATYDCVVQSNRPVKIQWTRASRDMQTKAVTQIGRLIIPNLVVADSDTYICSSPTDFPSFSDNASLFVIPGCRQDEFSCSNVYCIPANQRCDRRVDCRDGSDEQSCPQPITISISPKELTLRQGSQALFECSITVSDTVIEWYRNGNINLQPKASMNRGRLVIPEIDITDAGHYICSAIYNDRTYTESARLIVRSNPACTKGMFMCANRQCIPQAQKCDNRQNCQDGSDEANCPLVVKSLNIVNKELVVNEGETAVLKCVVQSNRPVKIRWTRRSQDMPTKSVIQDGRLLIPNLVVSDSDIYICSTPDAPSFLDRGSLLVIPECRLDQFTCTREYQCIPFQRKCDGVPDCVDRSDEEACGCRQDEFNCSNGDCIPSNQKCDRRVDCRDGSDEQSCPQPITINISPKELTLKQGSQALFECSITVSDTVIEWYRNGNIDLQPKASVDRGRLVIPEIDIYDAGDYICSAIYNGTTYTESARLTVRSITLPTTALPVGPCGPGQAVCQNGQCIQADYRCDGEKDCDDGSDENCPAMDFCESNEFRCKNNNCAMKIWRCDGDDDCKDNSDEESCPSRKPGDPCDVIEFQCMSADQCIPSAYQCDGEIDCQDHSDEIGCSPPVINLPPVAKIDLELGGTFTIICEAVGTPTPLIVWRLNLGNIPTGDRVFTSSVGGRGNLTITGARIEDSGAYTCEAINTRGSIFVTPDAIIIVRRYPQGVCKLPYFNVEASITGDCVRCFCFGHSDECYSSNLHVSQINVLGEMSLIDKNASRSVEQGYVQQIPTLRGAQVSSFNRLPPNIYYYWSLPREFLSERLTSYGGHLKYNIYYDIAGSIKSPTEQSDVIITGNGITLYYRTSNIFTPRQNNTVTVPLLPRVWTIEDLPKRGDTPVRNYATREDLMMVLENMDSILIRSQYDTRQTLTRLSNVILTTGISQDAGLGRSVNVEYCVCNAGHTGLSCQDCAVGYYRVRGGQYLGNCVRCRCNGHSNDCDPITGQCRNCLHNIEGNNCERCARGYYGDATRGTKYDCQACPCPLTESTNQFSPSCELDPNDGQVTCTACPPGYEGRRCERCARNYGGNPLVVGDYCRVSSERCDSRGSLSQLPDPQTRQCQCKANAYGPNCDQCRPNSFYLSVNNPAGCVSCFCFGVSNQCTSTHWNRAQVGASFTRDTQGFSLVDLAQRQEPITEGFTINSNVRELIFRRFQSLPSQVYYWSLPQRFLGDKVTCYGGNLRFVISYRPGLDTTPQDATAPLAELVGNDITLVYKDKTAPTSNTPTSYTVPFYEQYWTRPDGEPATREFLLMALADIDVLLIRATFTRDTNTASLRDVTMDIAEDRESRQDRAYAVEQCACPQRYKGLSCEDCDVGFTRSGGGLYLGLCERCQCNQHSSECDPDSGVCRNCQHNTEGDHCERCAPGYYGNARQGSPNSCQPCPCPLTEPPNQFSPVCELASDGQVTCTACTAGHTGRRCESCIQGYTGNPLRPGDYCKIGPVGPNCNCDSRGTVPNAQCDPTSLQCQCKPFVRGLSCNTCKEGYFYLDQSNQQGCLACWCNSITNQCSSSSYYRDQLIPQLASDGRHNFALTNRRLSNTITDGFQIDVTRNEIRFPRLNDVQRERESLFFSLPPKFRGNQVASYGGVLRFTLETHVAQDGGSTFRDVDIEVVTSGQKERMYHLFEPALKMYDANTFEILLRESSFRLSDGSTPTREAFLRILSNIEAILIRATYHTVTSYTALRDLRMDTAVPTVTSLGRAPMVESCRCPEGYTGLSCEQCANGYLRVQDSGSALGRCIRCNCHDHSSSCDPESGVCLNCQHNTEGERCERCSTGYYGVATSGTPNDCRACPCPLTVPSNQFSKSCFLDSDGLVTCDRCPTGYIGRNCERCDTDRGYTGNPKDLGVKCDRINVNLIPVVVVNPAVIELPVGQTIVFQCEVKGPGPFNTIWSRVDGQPLPINSQVGPRYTLTIRSIEERDAGRYVCTATNVHGSNKEYVNLIVLGREEQITVNIEPPKEQTVDEGTSVRFVCVAKGAIESNYILSWTKVNGQMPNRAIDQNGVLVIPNVRPEDAGNYECTGSDMFHMATDVATLIVSASQISPQVRIEPTFQTVNEFNPVEFRCIATGRPAPKVEWYRKTGTINPSAVISGGLLRIPAVLASDESEYYCKASSVAGTTEVRTILYVTKNPKPPTDLTVIVRQVAIIATVGSTAQLVCYVEDNTLRPTLFWSKSGGLPTGSVQDNGALTLNNIQPSHGGTYVCTAVTPTGGRGTGTATVTVTDQNEVPTAKVAPERTTIAQGTTGTLRCTVSGSPPPKITWSKSRGELTAHHQAVGETLRITNAQIEDRGVYICRAENVAGSGQGWAIVEVERRAKPMLDVYPSLSQTVKIGESAMFQCRVMGGDLPPTVAWSRSGGEPLESTTKTTENGVLMFTAVTGKEAGGYVCTATNDMGSVTATATLVIQGPPRVIIYPGNKVYAVIGKTVSLECIGKGNPIPTVQWQYERPPEKGDIPTSVESAPGAGSATLTLTSVTRSDAGNYQCTAKNVGGSVRETVQVIVQENQLSRETGVYIKGSMDIRVQKGQTVTLECDTEGIPNAVVRWRKRDGQMPTNRSVRGGTLTIPNFRSQYSGEYICSATAAQRNYEASVFIIVTGPPRVIISQGNKVYAVIGKTISLECIGKGDPIPTVQWQYERPPEKGDIPTSVESAPGTGSATLTLTSVTRSDAGNYQCTAKNVGGSVTETVQVIVQENQPSRETGVYIGGPGDIRVQEGQTVTLECDTEGIPNAVVRWRKRDGQMPPNHSVRGGTLTIPNFRSQYSGEYICSATAAQRIFNVAQEDSGRYICTASSPAGIDKGVVRLDVQDSKPNGGNKIDTQNVNIGERVEMECVVTGDPTPIVTWSRVDDPLPDTALINDVFLVIPQVRMEDAGIYVCTAQNIGGIVQQRVHLFVKARPIITGSQADSMTAALGSTATMECDAVSFPEPDITLFRKDGQMPSEYTVGNDGRLTIPKVRPDDAGMYVCNANNALGQTEHPMELVVVDLVPYFPQNPVSYITYPPMNDVYLDFDILLTLKPEATDGLVLYNGNDDTGRGDYVCFGLREGYPEFTFDVGSGPAIIQSNETLNLNQWHTVRLERNRKTGKMTVDNKKEFSGETRGRFIGLDLAQDMYLGGVPDFSKIPQPARYTTGIVGVISQVQRNGDNLNLGADALSIEGVEMYDACQYNPCKNGARCVPSNTGEGYKCTCPQGFTGDSCEQQGQRCYAGACGSSGRCRDLTNGFTCICPMGMSGAGCLPVVKINLPQFNTTSFAAYPAAQNAKFEMKIEMDFKPQSLEDGIILYSGQDNNGTEDYLSIAIRNGYLEFRYNTGSGPVVLGSRRRLTVNEWVKVVASRSGKEGTLIINDEKPVKAASPGTTISLDLRTRLYIGGTGPRNKLPQSLGISNGMIGCVAELTINSQPIDLITKAVETYNVEDCGERNICNRRPCLHGGVCETLSSTDYKCVCPTKFTGRDCEIQINVCITKQPCQNNAPCSITDNGYRCDCPLGYIGVHCEGTTLLGEKISLTGDGYLEFDKSFLSQTSEKEVVRFTVRTTKPDGLIFWKGQATPAGLNTQSKDYVSVGLKGGYVEYSYKLGSEPVVLRSLQKVNDGYEHSLEVTRLGRQCTLKIDNKAETLVEGTSQGILQMLNAGSNLYIGGVSAVETMTGNRFKENFNGCISNIYFMDKGPLRAPEDAVRGLNVRPCQ